MGEIWIKEAERLGDGSVGGAMDSPSAPGRVVWHTTESGHGDANFKNVGDYLRTVASEPHILYDPTTDRLGQYGPLNQSARALKNDGITRTNRTGKVCIQIEVLAKASNPFTGYWKPGPNFKALMRAIRSWGVPDTFPMGTPAATSSTTKRNRTTWATKGGHYGHCNVPGNDHWDPGAISTAALFKAAPVTPAGGGSTSTPSASTYTVKAGDTLSSIGTKTGVKWETLASLNSLKSPYTIKVGQVLKLKASTTTKPATKPSVSVAHLNAARAKDIPAATGHTTYAAEVKVVEAALKAEGHLDAKYASDGSWGTTTDAAYEAFRRAHGYKGDEAKGAVGLESLKILASRHAFTAKA
ncbi:LysM peptidoglycan-binding domain-containing protein [Streptomyces sp. NPDC005302]|uniref:LysM peptidoglycan-binding domain-containing protein n=1 Tax=Streptomyces sp. NPDC005302 TaxID=3154675 RepID=UPI00339EBDC0